MTEMAKVNHAYQEHPPIYQQPATNNTTVIVNQPMESHQSITRRWNSGLCSCCLDMESCCCVFWLQNCYLCCLYSRYGECCCSCYAHPTPLTTLRTQHRNRHKITGNIGDDLCMTCLCYWCVMCQLKRDMDYVYDLKGTLDHTL